LNGHDVEISPEIKYFHIKLLSKEFQLDYLASPNVGVPCYSIKQNTSLRKAM
jgi:hypothetical protein